MKYLTKRDHWSGTVEIKGVNLKNCPFCGNAPRLLEIPSDPEEGPGMGYNWYRVNWYRVTCDCGAAGPSHRYNKELAVTYWNIRAQRKI